MERRLCQAVGGQGGGSWTPLKGWVLHGALEHPNKAQSQPGTLPHTLPSARIVGDLVPHQAHSSGELRSEQKPAEGKILGFK